MTYELIEWPEIQDYMDHPRWNECFNAQSVNESDSRSYWFVPDDIVEEVEYGKFQNTAQFIFDGQLFIRDFEKINKGDLVCFVDDAGKMWTDVCVGGGRLPYEPYIFEGNETPGIGCYIEGVKI